MSLVWDGTVQEAVDYIVARRPPRPDGDASSIVRFQAAMDCVLIAASRANAAEKRVEELSEAARWVLADVLDTQTRGRTQRGHVDEDGCWCCSCHEPDHGAAHWGWCHEPDHGAAHWGWCESKRENVRTLRDLLHKARTRPAGEEAQG